MFDVGSLEVRRRKAVDSYGYHAREKFRKENQDLTEDEANAISSLLSDLSAVDFAEIYSPERFKGSSAVKRLNLKPGCAVDLSVKKWN
eukprot:4254744-Karenia_brevis.AAC.1